MDFQLWRMDEPAFRPPDPGARYHLVVEGRTPGRDVYEALEDVYVWGQKSVDGRGVVPTVFPRDQYSVSVGDVVLIESGFYLCDAIGWSPIRMLLCDGGIAAAPALTV